MYATLYSSLRIKRSESEKEPRNQVPKESFKSEEGWHEIFKIVMYFFRIYSSFQNNSQHNLKNYGKITQFNVEIAIICENMCKEGSESKSGSEEGLNVCPSNLVLLVRGGGTLRWHFARDLHYHIPMPD